MAVDFKEASGITRVKDQLLIVGDEASGGYWFVDLTNKERDDKCLKSITITKGRAKWIKLKGARLAIDLESIDCLADGRVVVLSERLRALIGKKKQKGKNNVVIAEYDKQLSEFGNRGLEGLAVDKQDDESSNVAVLWEGGYPESEGLTPELNRLCVQKALSPIVMVHKIKKNEIVGDVNATFALMKPLNFIELQVPHPKGKEPDAQRFRAPDLVWHTWTMKKRTVTGFIALLSSEDAASGTPSQEKYKYKRLQRFDLQGHPVGEPIDIDAEAKRVGVPKLVGANWEGLGWYEKGKKLMLIHDKPPKDTTVLIIDLGKDWQ